MKQLPLSRQGISTTALPQVQRAAVMSWVGPPSAPLIASAVSNCCLPVSIKLLCKKAMCRDQDPDAGNHTARAVAYRCGQTTDTLAIRLLVHCVSVTANLFKDCMHFFGRRGRPFRIGRKRPAQLSFYLSRRLERQQDPPRRNYCCRCRDFQYRGVR